MTDEQIKEIKDILSKAKASHDEDVESGFDDDFDPQSRFGGNFDDCYHGGFDDGYAEGQDDLATKLLKYFS